MEMSDCKFLRIFPDISNLPNLRKLTLDNCINLVKIHPSVGALSKLKYLRISRCLKLERLPRIKLRSLQCLDLKGCSRLKNFPEIECKMESLRNINFGNTALKVLPSSIGNLTGVINLNLEGCKNLTSLPSTRNLKKLKALTLAGCKKLEEILELPPDIEVVNAAGCISLERFPEVSKRFDGNTCDLPGLVYVDLSRCHKLLENMENDVWKSFCLLRYLSL
jgi:hypothetical protein